MGRTVVIRYRTSPEAAEENQLLGQQVFAELAAEDPGGLRYMTLRLADGVTFVHVAVTEGGENRLNRSAAFAAFQKGISERCVEPPAPSEATVIGSCPF